LSFLVRPEPLTTAPLLSPYTQVYSP
jgi:hypothetical protein